MKNKKNFVIPRIIIMTAAVITMVGILAISTNPESGLVTTVDAASSATTIATPTASVVSVGYESLKVSWTVVSNASRYDVYRATSATGTFSKAATVTGTSLTDTGRVTGKYYYFKVRAVVLDGSDAYSGKFSDVKSGRAIPATTKVTLTKSSATSIKVVWTGVAGATKYQIYRATSLSGTYSLAYTATSTARSWVNTGRTPGKTYYYKVRAYHLEGTTKVTGRFSTVKYLKV